MKKFIMMCAALAAFLTASAQAAVDNFIVGPYEVDYIGDGEVKYRLRNNVDLYEFFELRKDTVITAAALPAEPVVHAIQISGHVGAARSVSKEIGIEGVWKQRVAKNLYFNGGLSFSFDLYKNTSMKRNVFELGIPLQIEYSQLNYRKSSLYGIFGLAPTIYSTLTSSDLKKGKWEDGVKKSGFLIAPSLEFGGNIPLGKLFMRVGVYGEYKVNCTTSEVDIYKTIGRISAGAKIGVMF